MMLSEFLKFPLLFVFGFFLLISTSGLAQSRVNTKELSAKLEKVAEEQFREAEALEKKAEASQRAMDAAVKAIEASKQRTKQYQNEISELEKELVEILAEMVKKIMAHPTAGNLIKENPELIKTIPVIKKMLQKKPWLDPALDELVKAYI